MMEEKLRLLKRMGLVKENPVPEEGITIHIYKEDMEYVKKLAESTDFGKELIDQTVDIWLKLKKFELNNCIDLNIEFMDILDELILRYFSEKEKFLKRKKEDIDHMVDKLFQEYQRLNNEIEVVGLLIQ